MWAFVSQFAVKWHTAESLKGFSLEKQNMIGQIAKIFKVQPVKAFTSKSVTSKVVCGKSKQLASHPHASQLAWGFCSYPFHSTAVANRDSCDVYLEEGMRTGVGHSWAIRWGKDLYFIKGYCEVLSSPLNSPNLNITSSFCYCLESRCVKPYYRHCS